MKFFSVFKNSRETIVDNNLWESLRFLCWTNTLILIWIFIYTSEAKKEKEKLKLDSFIIQGSRSSI